jgi:CubicO group peptidase (beta-lactamase class C family)
LRQHGAAARLVDISVYRLTGHTATFAEVIAETRTDAVVVLHDGQIVLEHYVNGMTEETPHLLMSVTKSVVGCIAGILVEQGSIQMNRPAATSLRLPGRGSGRNRPSPAEYAHRG